jgi:predicted Zn-dependent peptidase
VGARRTSLESGAVVASVPLVGVESATFALYFPTGSRYETVETNGISHFLEHLVFKGTPTRSADQVNREIDLLGGGANAFTSKEALCFHARVLAEHLPRLAALFGDLAAHGLPAGVEPELEREREVILSEISAVEDSPEELVGDLVDRAFFGEHALALPVVGCATAVRRLGLAELREHLARHVVARGLVVAAAGRVDHDALVALVREHLAELRPGPDRPLVAPPQPCAATRVAERDTEQVQVTMAAPGLTRRDPRRHVAELLSVALGEGYSSRLFREVRDRRGLAYTVFSSLASYSDAGSLQVSFGTAPGRLDEALAVVSEVLRAVRDGDLRDEEIEAARQHARTGTLLASESSEARASHLAEQLLAGSDELEIEHVLRSIAAVSAPDVRELAAQLLAAPLALAVVGPVDAGRLPAAGWELGRS